MERTFSMEYSAMKGERAEQRHNRRKHAKTVDCGGPPGLRWNVFRAEHGSSAAQKAQEPFFKETKWAARRRDENRRLSDHEDVRQGGATLTVKATHSKAERKEAHERRLKSMKANKAHKERHAEEDEVEVHRQPKHHLVPAGWRFFGAAPPRRAPQRPRRRPAAEEAPTPRRRTPGTDALTQRLGALNGGARWPTGVDEVVRIVAARLRKLRPSNRPASGPVFERWLKHQSCCTVRVDMLMTPGALVEALLPLLEDAPSVHRAVAPFVTAGRGIDMKDPGPSEEDSAAAAMRARRQLRVVGEEKFCSWPWPQCARWLCSQSYVLFRVQAEDVIAELRRLGVFADGGEAGRIVYDEAALASVGEQGKRAEWCVMDLEKVARVACCQKSTVQLGWGLALRERRDSLKLAELAKLKVGWLEAAAARLGERAPGIMSLRAKFNKAQSSVVLHTCVLGSEESVSAEDACKAIVHAVKADIAEKHSPRGLRIDDLVFRGSLRELRHLEMWLRCVIELGRDDEGQLTGSAWLTFSRHSTATDDQAREILRLAFSEEPAFRCPGLLAAGEAAWLAEEPDCQHSLVLLLKHHAQVIIEAWQPEQSADGEGQEEGSLDLCGWPCAQVWGGYDGDMDGAPAWFLQEAVPRAKEAFLQRWKDRLQWFPEARARSKFRKAEEDRERQVEESLEKAVLSGKKVLIAGGTASESGYPKRW